MRTVKLPNFKITNYDRNGTCMALKSTDHELSKFGMVCQSLAPPTLQGVFLSIVGQT